MLPQSCPNLRGIRMFLGENLDLKKGLVPPRLAALLVQCEDAIPALTASTESAQRMTPSSMRQLGQQKYLGDLRLYLNDMEL